MKKALIFICLIILTSVSYAQSIRSYGKAYNSETGRNDLCIRFENESGDVVNNKCQKIVVPDEAISDESGYFLLRTGVSTYAYTSMTSAQTAINASYSLIRKAIAADPAFSTGTLPNGTRGKIITIQITVCPEGATWTLTPTTKTGFNALKFEGVGDIATLLYVDDTTGWIRLNFDSVQSL